MYRVAKLSAGVGINGLRVKNAGNGHSTRGV